MDNPTMTKDNLSIKAVGDKLIIEVDLANPLGKFSTSGKSVMLASLGSNFRLGDMTIGLNIYAPAPDKRKVKK